MDQSLIRGAAAALLALEVLAVPRANAQGGGGGVIQARPTRDSIVMRVQGRQMGDSVFMRVFDATSKAKLDTIMLKWRSLDEESALSQQSLRIRREVEALVRELSLQRSNAGGPFLFRDGPPEIRQLRAVRLKGWIGLTAGLAPFEEAVDSSGYYVHYYRYPSVVSVEPNSPAHRAGITAGDVLIAYDGQDVVRERVKMSDLLIPDRKLEVTVRRDGESRDFSLTVAKTPERIAIRRLEPGDFAPPFPERHVPRGGVAAGSAPRALAPEGQMRIELVPEPGAPTISRVWFMDRNGSLGAGLVTIDAALAKATSLAKGVLIQQCGEETPAFKGGLRTGDIIVSVGGQSVNTVGDVQMAVISRRSERAATFQVIREKKPVALNVKW